MCSSEMKSDQHQNQPSDRRRYLAFLFGLIVVILLLAACEGQPTIESTSSISAQIQSTLSPGQEKPQPGLTQSPSLATEPPSTSPAPQQDQADATVPVVSVSTGCTSPAALTPALTEGPYFKAGSPERASLVEPEMPGTQLILSGYVLTVDCQPVPQALLDFWQADANGVYDNSGYTLRGHQFTDAQGFYQLTTVIPGIYPGRTEHIHFKVQAPNGPILTSQLFFPGVSNNESDQIFDPALVITITQENNSQVQATYNFIITP
jgi:protocatechuate 3,4-dioxygenase beta subunit